MAVIVYSTSTCPRCKRVKEFLNENKVSFENVDVSVNPDKVEELQKKSGQMSVPVIDVDGKIIVGANEKELREVLNIK